MLAFMWWIIIGLVAGLLARMLVPGRQPMGWLLTIGLGLLGSFVGGMISSAVFGTNPQDPGFQTSGLIMSTVGAVIVLALYLMFEKTQQPYSVSAGRWSTGMLNNTTGDCTAEIGRPQSLNCPVNIYQVWATEWNLLDVKRSQAGCVAR